MAGSGSAPSGSDRSNGGHGVENILTCDGECGPGSPEPNRRLGNVLQVFLSEFIREKSREIVKMRLTFDLQLLYRPTFSSLIKSETVFRKLIPTRTGPSSLSRAEAVLVPLPLNSLLIGGSGPPGCFYKRSFLLLLFLGTIRNKNHLHL